MALEKICKRNLSGESRERTAVREEHVLIKFFVDCDSLVLWTPYSLVRRHYQRRVQIHFYFLAMLD